MVTVLVVIYNHAMTCGKTLHKFQMSRVVTSDSLSDTISFRTNKHKWCYY